MIPNAYEKPWTASIPAELATSTDVMERRLRVENEKKSLQHMIGR